MNKNIIVVNNLTKKYKITDKFALDGIDLKIKKGSIFGLLGPNGAGKSTFINILAGLVNKTSGEVRVFDLDLDKDPKTIRGNLGVVPQEINIDPFFTPMQVMNNQAGMYGIKNFTAIINPPQSAILAVGSGQKLPIVKDDKVVICNVMNVTLSCDHRAIDGAVGAKFLQVFKKIIENPMLMSL